MSPSYDTPLQRIRDGGATNDVAGEAARLLRSQPALAPSHARRIRNWQAIEERLSDRRKFLPWILSKGTVVAVVLLLTAGAAAAFAPRLWPVRPRHTGDHVAPGVKAVAPPPPIVTPSVEAVVETPPPVEPAPVSVSRREPRPTITAVNAPSMQPSASESKLLLSAISALRRDGDPGKARALAQTYLRRHPRGALAEDALALLVQAEAALGSPNLRAQVRRYLETYPKGRFRERIEALQESKNTVPSGER